MILHTVNKSPYSHQTLNECLRLCTPDSSILFIEDGVLAVSDGSFCQKLINDYPELQLYALQADIEARGISVCEKVVIVNDEGFVDLVVQHDCVQSWF